MRLLELTENGDVALTEFVGELIPEYAILSHTWGADQDEVTFKDLSGASWKSKAGYDKIRFCGLQASQDTLRHFWIDTCAIDKSSSTELAEAINSMFRWYQNASKCYVYLSDVSADNWETDFRVSRWWTRGWTLQELVAPKCVEFFSREGVKLGDKASLEHQIHEITGIPRSALRKEPLDRFSIRDRLLWTRSRQTKRVEDGVYSLLGIFDVYMPLIYGEGRENALIRLRGEIVKRARISQSDDECFQEMIGHPGKRFPGTLVGFISFFGLAALTDLDWRRIFFRLANDLASTCLGSTQPPRALGAAPSRHLRMGF